MKRCALATLRFLNLLEPGRNMISITKTAMWVSLVAVIWGCASGSTEAVAALASLFASSSLYAFRRFVFWKTGQLGTDRRYAFGRGAIPEDDNDLDSDSRAG